MSHSEYNPTNERFYFRKKRGLQHPGAVKKGGPLLTYRQSVKTIASYFDAKSVKMTYVESIRVYVERIRQASGPDIVHPPPIPVPARPSHLTSGERKFLVQIRRLTFIWESGRLSP